MLDVVGVMHFRLKSENAPVLVESADPFFKRGLGLLSFGIFPLQEQRKVHKPNAKKSRNIRYQNTFPLTNENQFQKIP